MNRRCFLNAATCTATLAAARILAAPNESGSPTARQLPRWRGFNLLEKFDGRRNRPFVESDFAWMAEWGFDFARLPLSYHCWAEPTDWLNLREPVLKEIDRAVEFGRKHGVHVNINFHRAPGYCVNLPKEPRELWSDKRALEACAFHWAHFAKRFRGIPNSQVSFDLLNEPADIPEKAYARVVTSLVEAIRAEDANRLIIADGLRWGTVPVFSLAALGVAQSTRGYAPTRISHYKASWMRGSDQWPEPGWPLVIAEKDVWNKQRLRREYIDPWQALANRGVGVHVGEFGAYNRTPHDVVLAWLKDFLGLWKQAGWGWALWNFRGSFGILDSKREDATYDVFRGHKLDRALLELLQAY